MFKKLPMIAASGAVVLGFALPVSEPAAKGTCTTHHVSYLAQGRLTKSSPMLTPSSSWPSSGTGSLTIKLQSVNHKFAKANGLIVHKTVKGTFYTYTTIAGAKVKFSTGTKSPAKSGDHVVVTGTVTEFSGSCLSHTPTIKIKTITVSK
jgi:hypothetical protein